MPEILYAILALAILVALVVLIVRLAAQATAARTLPEELARVLEEKHRAMLGDLHGGLAQQSDRLTSRLSEELNQTRETLHRLKLSLATNLGDTTDKLNAKIDQRLEQIAGKVNERLDEGFRKTNETFVNVMQRLATIDEAQKKIETLTGSVVSLQELLGDKRSRGAFGEVQLEALVRNVLPPGAFEMQYTLSNGARVDCVLKLPEPTGLVCVDSKFPLENYHRMLASGANDVDRAGAQRQFRADVRKHVDDIAKKYILPNETSDGAVMFVPAEAVFAEIHAYHGEVVDYANSKRVWIVSPTTLMAVLNTARAVLKDVETRKQIHVIREALVRLAVEFSRFDERLKDLARHIRQANEDVERIQVTGGKITQQFQKIEAAELEPPETKQLKVVELREEKENKGSG
ncbi:MAG: DNA recombination protein RmuC [Betaproteobacteria bacterium]|nr:DNA recombination protein RmuC [Betaproteobacteria bacterium]